MFCFLPSLLRRKKNNCAAFSGRTFSSVWLLATVIRRFFLNIHIQSTNLFQCHHFFPFSSAWRGDKHSKVFLYVIYYLKCITQQAGKELSNSVSFFNSIISTWNVIGNFPVPNFDCPSTEQTLKSRCSPSTQAVFYFHRAFLSCQHSCYISVSPILFCKASFNHARPQQTKP